jgi:hypothetical protein
MLYGDATNPPMMLLTIEFMLSLSGTLERLYQPKVKKHLLYLWSWPEILSISPEALHSRMSTIRIFGSPEYC